MKRLRPLLALTGVAALIPILAAANVGPTRVSQAGTSPAPQVQSTESASLAVVRPIAAAYGPPNYVATPEIISRVGEILGAIDSPQKRSELAESWLQYSKRVIDKDLEYRGQWLDLERAQLSRQQEVEQLRLEVARLQVQVEELRARNVQLERESQRTSATLGPGYDRPGAGPGPQSPAQKY